MCYICGKELRKSYLALHVRVGIFLIKGGGVKANNPKHLLKCPKILVINCKCFILQNVHEVEVVHCDKCEFSTNTKDKLKVHMRRVHLNTTKTCPVSDLNTRATQAGLGYPNK